MDFLWEVYPTPINLYTFKLLGVGYQSNMKWNSDIKEITYKGNRRLYHLRQCRNAHILTKVDLATYLQPKFGPCLNILHQFGCPTLGVGCQRNMKWNSYMKEITCKGNRRLYHLTQCRNAHLLTQVDLTTYLQPKFDPCLNILHQFVCPTSLLSE